MKEKIKPIAIYLPQFHPIEENNLWWGKGFTEWTNVTKAKSLFKNHEQPNLPSDTGFYDLRLHEARLYQEELAKKFGIYGFCYYHYWFSGYRLLNEPLDRKLKNLKEDFPFMLCWANETWSRRWLGEEKEILIKQEYSHEDDINHIKWLVNVFKDDRYIKINNRPVFIFYRPTHIPGIRKTLEIFCEEAIKSGLEKPYLIASNSHSGTTDLFELGFDDILNFQPKLGALKDSFQDQLNIRRVFRNLGYACFHPKLKIYEYEAAKKAMDFHPSTKFIPCNMVGWDNSPRRGNKGIVLVNRSIETFKNYLRKDINVLKAQNRPSSEQFIFINAWNEWAEGNFLEPSIRHGLDYLKAVKEVLDSESI
jgi:lipopolysaccharide biosynthesis protein